MAGTLEIPTAVAYGQARTAQSDAGVSRDAGVLMRFHLSPPAVGAIPELLRDRTASPILSSLRAAPAPPLDPANSRRAQGRGDRHEGGAQEEVERVTSLWRAVGGLHASL